MSSQSFKQQSSWQKIKQVKDPALTIIKQPLGIYSKNLEDVLMSINVLESGSQDEEKEKDFVKIHKVLLFVYESFNDVIFQ